MLAATRTVNNRLLNIIYHAEKFEAESEKSISVKYKRQSSYFQQEICHLHNYYDCLERFSRIGYHFTYTLMMNLSAIR